MTRVLVVDDDFMVARIHTGFVQRTEGFTVVGVAHTGTEALAAVEQLRPELVLLDIYLPDISGLEVLRRLREREHPVDVLAITAASDVETIRAALHGGVVHYIIKPFSAETLREQLARYAARMRRLAELPTVAQADVDRLFGMTGPAAASLPKGLSTTTSDLVAGVLRESRRDLSAVECAELAGLSRVSTRRYLEHLVQTGRAEVRMRYGGTGRPEHRYTWRG
ncbi:response regulator [Catellatospora citrea]|uniref:Transcriptional regulatory protein n=1 Tax=Catellatospora citrea TaxID=53366 RepID=A0A8J3P0H8_9ACTN|nr:response regulator [Catellatospora citrea]RKE12160.1 two-component system CitB family response regulator [Catellatospora citrea]GIF98876.1 transcriptional regulatory protein [Catellatospora citrea]